VRHKDYTVIQRCLLVEITAFGCYWSTTKRFSRRSKLRSNCAIRFL